MTRFRALGIAWLATALFSLVITFVFRTERDGYVVTLVLGMATVALGAWLLLRSSGRAVTMSAVFGVAWLAVYGTLAVVQGDEARVTDTFLAAAGTAIGYAAWKTLGGRTQDEGSDIHVASDEPAAPGTGWLRLAATLYVFLGLAFGVSAPVVLAFYADNGYLPTMLSFRALAGPVEELGRTAFLAAGFALVASSAVSVVAGLLLWRGQRRGVQLGLLVDPVVFALGLGFALPLLLIGVPVRAALVVVGMWQGRREDLDAARQP